MPPGSLYGAGGAGVGPYFGGVKDASSGVSETETFSNRISTGFAARGFDVDNSLEAVDEELCGCLRPFVGLHVNAQWLPRITIDVAERTKTHEAALGRDQGAPDQATGRRQHCEIGRASCRERV